MNIKIKAACVALLTLCSATAAQATVINSAPNVQVDGSSTTVTVDVTASDIIGSSTISDLNILLDFTKCGGNIPLDGICSDGGFSFSRETVFTLTSAEGTDIRLITEDTYSGQTPGDRIQVLFDDDATTTIGGPALQSGTFQAIDLLALVNGESILGTWSLFIQDTVGADPLRLNNFSLAFNNNVSEVPLPAAAPLFLSAILGGGFISRRRKKA